jgi:hypothetical protein
MPAIDSNSQEEVRRGTCTECRKDRKSCSNFRKEMKDLSDCIRCTEKGLKCIEFVRKNRVKETTKYNHKNGSLYPQTKSLKSSKKIKSVLSEMTLEEKIKKREESRERRLKKKKLIKENSSALDFTPDMCENENIFLGSNQNINNSSIGLTNIKNLSNTFTSNLNEIDKSKRNSELKYMKEASKFFKQTIDISHEIETLFKINQKNMESFLVKLNNF